MGINHASKDTLELANLVDVDLPVKIVGLTDMLKEILKPEQSYRSLRSITTDVDVSVKIERI